MSDGTLARDASKTWPRYFDWAGACAYLSVSRDGLYRLVRDGLPAIRIGGGRGHLRFDRLRVDAWMAEQAMSDGHVPQSTRRIA